VLCWLTKSGSILSALAKFDASLEIASSLASAEKAFDCPFPTDTANKSSSFFPPFFLAAEDVFDIASGDSRTFWALDLADGYLVVMTGVFLALKFC